jgi:methylphosphotriester-DNA--protein-cysteine methyltransferase
MKKQNSARNSGTRQYRKHLSMIDKNTKQVTIKADFENNAETFWAAFDEAYPEIANQVREGGATVDSATWRAIQSLEGFSDGPSYARDALMVVE